MPHSAVLCSLPPTSIQVPLASSPVVAAKPGPRNMLDLSHPSRRSKPLPPLPEEVQQDEIFNVQVVNHCNLHDDERATIKYPDPKRCVEWIGQQEIAQSEHATIEGLMGDFQSPYPMCSCGLSPHSRTLHVKPDFDVASHLQSVWRRHIDRPLSRKTFPCTTVA